MLWCYKKELGFSTHRKKRMKEIKKLMARGLYDPDRDDPFDLFISSTNIRWAYYKDSHKILGSTYGMLVLQDFEALTPNLLCRTIETVEGGGIVVLLLKTMNSLKQLYAMTMDVHSRFRTEAHQDVVARFNERFILSLSSCETCLVLDDELNVLPLSKHSKTIKALKAAGVGSGDGGSDDDGGMEVAGGNAATSSAHERELRDLKDSLAETDLIGALVGRTRTLDQAKAVLMFAEAISEKTLRNTVALTAARGRGKSAALGLAIASAVGFGYSNIFVTAPSPENLGTVFDFVFKGFDALAYSEHLDYEAVQSTNPDFNKAVVRVNVFRTHRQTIQYIQPQDADKLGQAELVVIDEAGAIPLPIVKKLLGPYLVFLASTVNGYEGTGRSLSLKLLSQLRAQQSAANAASASAAGGGSEAGRGWYKERGKKPHKSGAGAGAGAGAGSGAGAGASSNGAGSGSGAGTGSAGGGRSFREVSLDEPIRYGPGDPVEAWLNELLCLDATSKPYRLSGGCPHPRDCDLYVVDRDALFSYHKVSEAFLQRMMSLYVSSHYKNTPNDLQLMSDAPAHRVFALLGPVDPSAPADRLPDVLCVVQVALEGQIAKESVHASLKRGQRSSGDLIPWTMAQQYQDAEFAALSGARVVRIATHPDVLKMGYGTRALELLTKYYQGDIVSLDADSGSDSGEGGSDSDSDAGAGAGADGKGLRKEKIKPRKKLPPLLVALADRKPERLHYLGVSYGLTLGLFNFWKRAGYVPSYVRQTPNDITAEHTCIMLQPLRCDDLPEAPAPGWVDSFATDFARRFVSLLAVAFRQLEPTLAMSVLAACGAGAIEGAGGGASAGAAASAGAGAGAGSGAAAGAGAASAISAGEAGFLFTPHDVKRLEAYSKNLVDYHMVTDLMPDLARLFFLNRFGGLALSRLQSVVLLAVALQHKTVDELVTALNVPAQQMLALFNKSVRKMTHALQAAAEAEVEAEMAPAMSRAAATASRLQSRGAMQPLSESLGSELKGAGEAADTALAASQVDLLKSLDLMEYAVDGGDKEWDEALGGGRVKGGVPSTISVKATRKAAELAAERAKAAEAEAAGAGDDGGHGHGRGKGKAAKPQKRKKGGREGHGKKPRR